MKRFVIACFLLLLMASSAGAETDWQWRVYFFVRAVDATLANRNALAQIYVSNGGMETRVNEKRMFDNPVKLSTTGNLPAQAYGFNGPAKMAMRNGFKALLDTLTDARYGVVRHGDLGLVLTNMPGIIPTDQTVTWETALQRMFQEFGLQVIPSVEGP